MASDNKIHIATSFVNQSSKLNGLVRVLMQVTLPDFTYLNNEVTWVIRYEGQDLFSKSINLKAKLVEYETAFHSQYFQGEKCTFEFVLIDKNGNTLGLHQVEFESEKQGRVGDEVKKQIESDKLALFLDGKIDSQMFPYSNVADKPWFEHDNGIQLLNSSVSAGTLDPKYQEKFEDFYNKGYMVFEKLIGDDVIDRINADLDAAVEEGYQGYSYGSSQRIQLLHQKYDSFRELFLSNDYLSILDALFGAEALPCQTLTYLFGSQQDAHQDTVHLTPFPSGYMVGVWIALQDVVDDSGELVVFPGSHKLQRVYMNDVDCEKVDGNWEAFGKTVVAKWGDMVSAGGFSAEKYLPKKGDVLIWHENLMHEGSGRRNEELERRSLVIHAFAKGTSIYYDSTGEVGFVSNER